MTDTHTQHDNNCVKYITWQTHTHTPCTHTHTRDRVCVCLGNADLPPVEVFLIEDLQDVSAAEAKPRLLAGNQVVMGGVVVKVTLDKSLEVVQKLGYVKNTWTEGLAEWFNSKIILNVEFLYLFHTQFHSWMISHISAVVPLIRLTVNP